jgi:hypothetical protein
MSPQRIDKSKIITRQAYVYSDNVQLAGNGQGRIVFPIDLSFNFICTRFTYMSVVNSVNIIPAFTLQMKSNDKELFQNPLPNQAIMGLGIETSTTPDTLYWFGLGQPVFKFDRPYKFPAKSDIVCLLNNAVAVTNTITITLFGYKEITIL